MFTQNFWTKIVVVVFLLMAVFGTNVSLAKSLQYEDKLLTTAGTKEVFQRGLEGDGYALGILAYTWGYPVVRMERVAREYTDVSRSQSATSYRAPLNQIGWAKELASPAAKDMPTANNDTLYMSCVVRLDQPYVFEVPDTNDRYYVVNVFNMWHELEHYIGRRTTGTKAGRYVLVPPGWKGKLPSKTTRLDVTTDKIWLWGRLRVVGDENLSNVHGLQKEFKLNPLSQFEKNKKSPPLKDLPPLPDIENDDFGFLTHLAFALKENPIKVEDAALFAQLERIGLTKSNFDPSKLSPATKKGLMRALEDGPMVATASMASSSLVSEKQGWTFAVGLDDFGFNYPLRAMISGPYLGGNGEKEAIYPIRYTDSKGDALNGSKKYVIQFNEEPTVNAFWSLTVYNAGDKMMVQNPINRYKIGGDTPNFHKRSPGGYFEIPIQHEKPNGEFSSNWLPAPEGDFYLLLRFYQPKDEIFSKNYKFPEMRNIK